MCGILGYFRKHTSPDVRFRATILSMLDALGRRGPDSAGVALVGPSQRAGCIVRVKAGDEWALTKQAIQANREAIENIARGLERASDITASGVYVRFVLSAC